MEAQNAVFGGSSAPVNFPASIRSQLTNSTGNTGIAGGLIKSAVNSSTVQNAAKSLGIEIKTTEDSWWAKQTSAIKAAVIGGAVVVAFLFYKFVIKKGR